LNRAAQQAAPGSGREPRRVVHRARRTRGAERRERVAVRQSHTSRHKGWGSPRRSATSTYRRPRSCRSSLSNTWWATRSTAAVSPVPPRIQSDAELEARHHSGAGLIYNDYSGRGHGQTNDNVLHAAHCHWVISASTQMQHAKYWFPDLAAAVSWLTAQRGPEGRNWRRCGTCRGGALRT
jgi:hypothetical protein